MGTSLWLKIQTENVLKSIGISAYVQQIDLGTLPSVHPDVAISVSYMKSKVEGHARSTIFIDNLLQEAELKARLLENPFVNEVKG
ncbi:hypothetical protein [Alteribacter salitolerans]